MADQNQNQDFIPLMVPRIRGREWEYVKECLDTEWVSSVGPFVDRFEKEFAQYVGAKYAIACSCGTAALHVSLQIMGVKAGEEVLVPSLTFISSINSIKYLGADPVFLGSDSFYNLDASQLRGFLEKNTETRNSLVYNRNTGRRIAALMPVHVFGNAIEPEIFDIAREVGLPVVEDAAEALGTKYTTGKYSGRHAGTVGQVGASSFNGNKIITTGGGGMIITNDEAIARKAKYLTTQAKDDEIRFVHHEVGYNYRMTNVQAAIGVGQLETIEACVQRKREVYEMYREGLKGVKGLTIADEPAYARNNLWMFGLQVDPKIYGESREELMQRLSKKKIQSRPVWLLNHMQRPFAANECMDMKSATRLWELTLNIPNSVGITDEDVARVIREISRA